MGFVIAMRWQMRLLHKLEYSNYAIALEGLDRRHIANKLFLLHTTWQLIRWHCSHNSPKGNSGRLRKEHIPSSRTMRFAFAIAVVAAFISATAAVDEHCPTHCYTNSQCNGCIGRLYCSIIFGCIANS